MAQQGNIAQYTSPIDRIEPSEHGADAMAAAAIHEGRMYNQAGADYQSGIDRVGGAAAAVVDQHDTFQEISQGAHLLAAGTGDMHDQWNQMVEKADPNDKSIQGTFLDNTLEPFLDKFQSAFTTTKGQDWALKQADYMRQHFTDTTSADMVTRAGNAVLLNTAGQANQLKNSVYKDPSSLDLAFKQVDDYYNAAVEHNSGLINEKQMAKVDEARTDAKNEIVKNAIKGYADKGDPDRANALLASGNYDAYLPKNEADTLSKYIDTQSNAILVDKNQKAQLQNSQIVQQNNKQVGDILNSLSSGKGYSATLTMANTALSPKQKEDFLSKKDGILTLPPSFLQSPSYGKGFDTLSNAIYSGQDIRATDLTGGIRRQEITPAGAVQLQAISDKMRTPEGIAEAQAQQRVLADMKNQIVKGGSFGNDVVGKQLFAKAQNTFYNAWDAGIKAGKTPAELSDPESKDYIGNIANTFKRSDTQALADMFAHGHAFFDGSSGTPAATIPKPGEIPPADKRVVDKPYTNANGLTKYWTGNGWADKPSGKAGAAPTLAIPQIPIAE